MRSSRRWSRPIRRSTGKSSASPARSSTTSGGAEIRRCSNTRIDSIASTRRLSPSSRSAAPEMREALDSLGGEQRSALETAAQRIRAFHQRQLATSWSYTEADGTELGQRVDALQSVGLYVPGGLAAYPSSVLMNALPAQVAGVESIRDGRTRARRRAQRAGAGGGVAGRRDSRIHDRRRAGGGRARLRHADDRGGRQDRRSRQRVCCRRQAACVRHRRAST